MTQQLISRAANPLIVTRSAPAKVQSLSHKSGRRTLRWVAWSIAGATLTGLSLSLLVSGKAVAVSITFEKIADTNTSIPGGTGKFEEVYSPSLDDGTVTFVGGTIATIRPEVVPSGIYAYHNGELKVVADTTTPVPNGTGNFEPLFETSSVDNDMVAFRGQGSSESGIYYTRIGSKLNVVADTNTSTPSGTGSFGNLYVPSVDSGNIAFLGYSFDGSDSGTLGIYTHSGSELKVVADTTTPVPNGTDNFEDLSAPSLDGENVAFSASLDAIEGTGGGIYTHSGSELKVVADTTTPVPNGTGNFRFFSPPQLEDQSVAFKGSSLGQEGIYLTINGEPTVIADTTTPIPGSVGNFKEFSDFSFSLNNGNIAFMDSGSSQNGIYTTLGSKLTKVITEGNFLDGKQVSFLYFGSEGLSGNQVAFSARFSDNTRGIYVATVPEPASVLGTLAFAMFGAGWLLKRRQKNQALTTITSSHRVVQRFDRN